MKLLFKKKTLRRFMCTGSESWSLDSHSIFEMHVNASHHTTQISDEKPAARLRPSWLRRLLRRLR